MKADVEWGKTRCTFPLKKNQELSQALTCGLFLLTSILLAQMVSHGQPWCKGCCEIKYLAIWPVLRGRLKESAWEWMFRESNYHVYQGVYHHYAVLNIKIKRKNKKKKNGLQMSWILVPSLPLPRSEKTGLWESYFMHLCLHFLTCDMMIAIITLPQRRREHKMWLM